MRRRGIKARKTGPIFLRFPRAGEPSTVAGPKREKKESTDHF